MLKQEWPQREYELLKCQMLLNGHLWIRCIGIGKNSLAHYELACFKRSGQWIVDSGWWTVAPNGERRKITNVEESKRERVGGGKEVLSPSLPNPAPYSCHLF